MRYLLISTIRLCRIVSVITERQQLVASQASEPWELRAWYFGETEDQAKAALNNLSSNNIIASMSQKM
jgi:hypothetical protein